jgi:hypothetical protein
MKLSISAILIVLAQGVLNAQTSMKDHVILWHPDSLIRIEHFKSISARKGCDAYIVATRYFETVERSDTHQVTLQYAAMDLDRSWISPKAVAEGGERLKRILAHEQVHFDICELFMRIYRKNCTERCQGLHKHNDCYHGQWGNLEFKRAIMNEEFDQDWIKRWWKEDVTGEWKAKIRAQLDSLDAYKDPRVYLKIAP